MHVFAYMIYHSLGAQPFVNVFGEYTTLWKELVWTWDKYRDQYR